MPHSVPAEPSRVPGHDEELLSDLHPTGEKQARGVYFTPAPLVRSVLDVVAPLVAGERPLAIIDPACGAGAFLAAAAERFPDAALFGLDLGETFLAACAARVPGARLRRADALDGGIAALRERLPSDTVQLWIGNPPYNGTSLALLRPELFARLRALLPEGFRLPQGTSLRDDFAFFVLQSMHALEGRRGVLAYVTPRSLLDAFLYAPVRAALLEHLALREVLELGPGMFRNARVDTCVTVWSTGLPPAQARFRSRVVPGRADAELAFTPPQPLEPRPPEFLLRSPPADAEALHRLWSERGEPLDVLVPVSLPGLKTRFDELLVDDDPDRLGRRIEALLTLAPNELDGFARAHRLPERTWPKLALLHAAALRAEVAFDPRRVRPFWRYAGARHRLGLPPGARAWCYLDRRLIPRGDHRFRGAYDPHQGEVKLLFNVRERPLCATVLEAEGCVHDHRHTRFAPLLVPERLRVQGLGVARGGGPLGPMVPNLSPRGLDLAERLGGPLALFRAIARFVNSAPVQERWVPAFGASRVLPVPLEPELLRILGAAG